MKKHLKTISQIAIAASTALLFSCAKPLPELPIYVAPAMTSTTTAPVSTEALPTINNTRDTSDTSRALAFIANDLVTALSYISGISPNLVSLRTSNADTLFDELVKTALVNKGYSVDQRFDRTASEQLATAFLEKRTGSGQYEITGIISINSVLVKRIYLLRGNTIEPQTTYSIRGVNPQLVRANDQIQVL